ncbi:MAG TPA: phage tail protein, partial [Acinetobacter nosocomialis]|nr:phage tail protein [Acinetobacter nosocomialis]
SWIKLPITGNNSVEVPGIYAGQYQARVTAISAFEIASLPVYSTLTELSGKQGLPPKLAFIQATGILFGMRLNWGFPATGALDTAYTEIQVSPDGTSNIAQLGLFAYPTTTHTIQGLQPNLTQFYRGRLIDRIGNIGPWSNWTHATTSADATDVLELLNDQISETQLSQDLKTKIDHIETIDAEIGPLKQDIQNTKDRIAQEVVDRQNAIQQAKDGLSQQIIDGDEGVLEVVNTVKQSSDDGLAAAQESIRVVANDLSLVAEKTDGVYAQLNPPLIGSESDLIGNDQGFAGTWSVQSAMIEGDLALSKRIDTTAVELNNLQAYAQREVQARIEGDRVTVQKIDNYIASNDSALATVRQSAQVAVEQSSANAEAIDLINLELDDKASTGQLTQVKSDIKNVDDKVAAQTVRIDGVFAQLNPPFIGSESDLIGNEGGYAGVWSEQSARIEGDLAQAKLTEQLSAQMNESNALFQQQINANASAISSTIKVTETLQTKVGKNSSSIQNVSESVDGIYAQQFIKFDVNGHVSGHGSMNDGTTSTFIFNYDRIQFGTPVGIDGIEPKPLMTLQNKPVTLPNGTVIPRGLYVDNGSFGYINANRIWAENLSVISADLGTIKVKTANIEDGAIDTLKIKDEAVTVPIGVKAIDIKTINTFSGGSTGGLPNNDFNNHLSAWENHIGTLLQVTLNRSGGKVRIDASVNICTPTFGAFSVSDGRGNPIAANDRAMASFYISIYRNGSLIGRGSLGANIETGNINVNFNGTAVIVSAIDDISTVGNVTYTLKAGFARQEGVNIPLNVSSNNTFMITSRTLSVIEMKK